MKSEVSKHQVQTQEEMLAVILDPAFSISRHKYQLKRTKHDLHTRVSKYIEVDGGIFEHLL
jgi:hypothetical protein